MKLLLISQWFPPAYKAGGPIQSAANLVELLRGRVEFSVLCSPFDLDGERMEYPKNSAIMVAVNSSEISRTVRNFKGIVYVNSLFSWKYGILPALLAKQLVVSPRGMLKASALQKSGLKKKCFLRLANALGIYKHAHFIASNTEESEEIRKEIKAFSSISVLSNVGTKPVDQAFLTDKKKGELNLLFVGRIHRTKNLLFLLQVLEELEAPVHLDIVGPIEDNKYWKVNQENAAVLAKKGHRIVFHNALPPKQIKSLLKKTHFLISPTLGENFGHAIFDAFAHSRPVIISDQTPWTDLQSIGCGWDIRLDKDLWASCLQQAISMDQTEYDMLCKNALKFAKEKSNRTELKQQYVSLFTELMAS